MSAGPLNTNVKAHKLVTEDKVRTALLKDKGPDAKYKSFNIIDFCTKGDNYSCFVTSVQVEY
ncbi:EcKinase 12, partial [Hyalella azteca]